MESKKDHHPAIFAGQKELESEPDLAEEVNQLAQIILHAEEAIKVATERLNELFESLSLKNAKENPYTSDLKSTNALPLSKKLKSKKDEDPLLKDDLKGRFRSFAKVYHAISKRP